MSARRKRIDDFLQLAEEELQAARQLLTRLIAAPVEDSATITPLVRSLRGSMRGADVDEEDYKRRLEEKYL